MKKNLKKLDKNEKKKTERSFNWLQKKKKREFTNNPFDVSKESMENIEVVMLDFPDEYKKLLSDQNRRAEPIKWVN